MKIKLKLKTRFTVNQIISLALGIVFLIELSVVYFSLIANLNPKAQGVVSNTIVSIDSQSYQSTSNLLDARLNFQPVPLNFINPNPFKYSR